MNRKWVNVAMLLVALLIVAGIVAGIVALTHAPSIDCPGGATGC